LEQAVRQRTDELRRAIKDLQNEMAERTRMQKAHDQFFNLSNDVIAVLDLSGRFETLNPAG
jgi:hypothetical protein